MKETGERLMTFYYNENTMEHLHRYAIAQHYVHGKKVLDIASGEGYGSHLLAQYAAHVLGVDVSQEAVEYAQSKYQGKNLEYQIGALEKIPCQEETFDVVISFETIEHTDKHLEGLAEIKRVLKKDGLLIMSSPNKLNYTDIPKIQNIFHVKELYIEEFKALIAHYFSFSVFLHQKVVYNSIVVPEHFSTAFYDFKGNFQAITFDSGLQNQIYDICLASNVILPPCFSSIFEGLLDKETIFNQGLREGITRAENTRTYKFGKWLLSPFSLLKGLLKKKKI